MKTNTTQLVFLGLSLAAAGCGKKKSDSTTTPAATDQADQTEQAMSGAEDASSALNEDGGGSGGAALRFAGDVAEDVRGMANLLAADTSPAMTRSCAAGSAANTAVITLGYTGSGGTTATKGVVTVTTTVGATGSETRTWTGPTGATAGGVACDTAATHAAIKWGDKTVVTGLQLAVTTNKSQTRSVNYNNTRKNVTKTIEADSSEQGARTITWGAPTVSASSITMQKTVSYSVTRGRTYTNAAGATTSFSSKVVVDPATPLSVTVTRAPTAPYAAQTQVINTGTMTATKTDNSVVSMTYNAVTYDLTSANANKCQPVSGTISGTSTPAGGTAAGFTIKFGDSTVDSGVSITYTGGTAQDYTQFNAKDCDLARS